MEKQPIYKKWWFWVIIALVIVAFIGSQQPAKDTAPEPVAETTPAAPEDPLLESFSKATGIKEAEIKQKDDYIEIIYTLDSTPYDYTDYVSKGLTHFVDTGKLLFGDCKTLRMDMQVDGSAATSLIMTKDNFDSVDWSSLAYTEGIYDQISDKFQKFYVESMLMKDVDTNKIMYKGK